MYSTGICAALYCTLYCTVYNSINIKRFAVYAAHSGTAVTAQSRSSTAVAAVAVGQIKRRYYGIRTLTQLPGFYPSCPKSVRWGGGGVVGRTYFIFIFSFPFFSRRTQET
jgi:hypothetical protein